MNENINCPNFILCGKNDRKDYFDCYGGTCLNCDAFFSRNKMIIEENIECSICADDELKNGIKFPNCSHYICIEDMKKYYRANKLTCDEDVFDNTLLTKCPLCREKTGFSSVAYQKRKE
jgi:hypothetical protein